MLATLHLIATLALGPLRARWRRNVLAVAAIGVGVALGLAVNLVNDAAIAEVGQAFRSASGTADVQITPIAASGTLPETLYGTLGTHPQLAAMIDVLSPVLEVDVIVANQSPAQLPQELRPESVFRLKLIGVDAFQAGRVQPQLLMGAEAGSTDTEPFDGWRDDAVALSPAALQALGLRVSERFTVRESTTPLRVTHVMSGAPAGQKIGVMDIAALQHSLNKVGVLSRLDVRLVPGVSIAAFMQAATPLLPPGVTVVTAQLQEAQAANMSRAYRVNLTMLALIALFSGGLLVFSTQTLSVVERRQELAFLRVLGATARETVGYTLVEAGLLGLVGALVGVALGYGLAWVALGVLGGDLGAGYFAATQHGQTPRLHFAPWLTIGFAALGAGAALAGAWSPAQEAARTPPAQALKSGSAATSAAWQGTKHDSRRAALGLLLGGIVGALLPAINGVPIMGYLSIAALLIGTIMAMPWIAAALFTRVVRWPWIVQRPLAHLAAQRLAFAPWSAGISLASVLAAVALSSAMAIMVASFRHSVETWLDRVLPAPAYLRQGEVDEQRNGKTYAPFTPAQQAIVATTPGIERVVWQRTAPLQFNRLGEEPRPAVVLVMRNFPPGEEERALALVERFPIPAEAVEPLAWVSESFLDQYAQELSPERRLTIPLPPNSKGVPQLTVRVAGTWRDYARRHGTIAMRLGDYTRVTGDATAQDAALWLAPGVTAAEAVRRIRSRLPEMTALSMLEAGTIRRLSLQLFDRTFTVTYALEAVAVLIGLAGMATAFAGLILARKKELGMLRHLGLTRRELTRLIVTEGALLAALGAAVGLALGCALAVVLVFVINRQSFGWSMDWQMPVGSLALFVLGLLAAATFTAWLTARHALSGDDIARSVREDW